MVYQALPGTRNRASHLWTSQHSKTCASVSPPKAQKTTGRARRGRSRSLN